MLEEPAPALLAAIDEALRAGLLRTMAERTDRFDFVHVLLRDALAARLPLDRRAALHARIAEALESLYGTEAAARATELALHFVPARSVLGPERAARYCLVASRQALERQAWEETVRHAQTGLQAMEGRAMDDLQAELLAVKAIAANLSGKVADEVTGWLEQAFEQFERSGNARGALEVATRAGFYLVPRFGQAFRDRALRLAVPGSADAGRVLVAFALGLPNEDYDGKCRLYDEALRIAEARLDTALRLSVLGFRSTMEYYLLHYQSWAEMTSTMADLAVRSRDGRAECAARASLTRALCFLGRRQEARPHLERVLELAESLGERQALLQAWSLAAWHASPG